MKQTENTTTEFKQLLLSLVGNAPLGIITVDLHGSITLINHKALQILNLPHNVDSYLDLDVQNILSDVPSFCEQIEACMVRGQTTFNLTQVAYHDKILTIKGRPILNGMLLTFEDITEIEQTHQRLSERTQQLENNNKELEQFAYISSHDLQEPLLTIISFSKLVLDKADQSSSADTLEFLQIIRGAAERMSAQITGLLEYSRIGRNKDRMQTDSAQVVERIKTSLHSLIEANKVQFNISELPTVLVFKEEFESLLQNLISNAIKYRKKDVNPTISVDARELSGSWQFSVTDNGIGIDEKYHERVFTIFQRLHHKNEYEGSGIGLAHCKKIVQLHQGKIWFTSVLGQGSTFYFTIRK
ncbi:ATP-binding protein [Tunicatimonas pelagia]|uniref:ATP-binding protein n=1 Tax=Tunicatimonas pelagia TaxID=931531 RepID=UPI002665C962|nr:ATP-binding protein [Tunicatimonas pelagia]WKN45194.1 ATP-binding protein [Tunicatimonas pelagia]